MDSLDSRGAQNDWRTCMRNGDLGVAPRVTVVPLKNPRRRTAAGLNANGVQLGYFGFSEFELTFKQSTSRCQFCGKSFGCGLIARFLEPLHFGL